MGTNDPNSKSTFKADEAAGGDSVAAVSYNQPPSASVELAKESTRSDGASSLTRLGAIVGLITGIVTLPKTGLELYQAVVSSPRTEALSGDTLVITYDPSAAILKLSSSLLLTNSGTSDDAVASFWAQLKPPDTTAAETASFAPADFEISSKGQLLHFPFSIPKGNSIDVNWQATARVSSDSIPVQSGDWRVSLAIITRGKRKPLQANFMVFATQRYMKDLKQGRESLRFVNPRKEMIR